MKILISHYFVKCALVLALSGWVAHAENQTNAAAKITSPVPKSTFVADVGIGKDPFFPNSTRGREVIEQYVPPTSTNSAPQPSLALNKLALKGISGVKGQRLALINSSTVGIGELAEIRCGLEIVRIRCLEIRDSSVVVALDGTGETKELTLRKNI